MSTFAVLPDLDAALSNFLDTHPDLTGLHDGRVGTSLPAGSSTSIRITNLGGPMPWPWMGRAEFQIECWGGTEVQANELARKVCAVIYDIRGAVSGGAITAAFVTLTPLSQPDPVTNRPRYILQVQLEATPQ